MHSSSAFNARVDVLSLFCRWHPPRSPEFCPHGGFGILWLRAFPDGASFGMDSSRNLFGHHRSPHGTSSPARSGWWQT